MASCPRPLHAFYTGQKLPTGGNKFIFKNHTITEIKYPRATPKGDQWVDLVDYIEIPCGKCEVCKANQARQKGERAMAEASSYLYNECINLTYNEENLPRNSSGRGTLRYKDVQLFKKRLLKYWKEHYNEDKIKFLCACEYGEQYGRPHYHMIMFNFQCHDKYDWGQSKKGSKQFRSPIIEKLWGLGNVTLGEVTPETIQYVSNYCLKKFKGKKAKGVYEKMGIEPEIVRGSNQNGLGSAFWAQHKETYEEHGKCFLGTFNGLKTLCVNRYYDELLKREKGEERLKEIKEERKNLMEAREMTRAKISGVDINTQRENDYKLFLEKIKKAKVRAFKEEG